MAFRQNVVANVYAEAHGGRWCLRSRLLSYVHFLDIVDATLVANIGQIRN